MTSTVGSAASNRNRPAIWRGVRDRDKSLTTRAHNTGSASTLRVCGRLRRARAAESTAAAETRRALLAAGEKILM